MKIAREQASRSHESVASTFINAISTYVSHHQGNIEVNYPTSVWGNSQQKFPFFFRPERVWKEFGLCRYAICTNRPQKATTFLKDEFLKNAESYSEQKYFSMRCKCYNSFRQNDNNKLRIYIALFPWRDDQINCALQHCIE